VYRGGGMAEGDEAQAQVMVAWGNWFEELDMNAIDPGVSDD
jgi:hypothetical protein